MCVCVEIEKVRGAQMRPRGRVLFDFDTSYLRSKGVGVGRIIKRYRLRLK